MRCRIKKIKKEKHDKVKDNYYVKFLFYNEVLSKITLKTVKLPVCDWTDDIDCAKIFRTKAEAQKEAREHKLKHIEYERVD